MSDVFVEYHGASDQKEDETDGPFTLTTSADWLEVVMWVETLPMDDYPRLYELTKMGFTTDTSALVEEIAKAVEYNSPEDLDAAQVLLDLLSETGIGDEEETIVVSVE